MRVFVLVDKREGLGKQYMYFNNNFLIDFILFFFFFHFSKCCQSLDCATTGQIHHIYRRKEIDVSCLLSLRDPH